MAEINISLQVDKDYLSNHPEHVKRAGELAARVTRGNERLTAATSERDAFLTKVRAALVAQNAGFSGAAEDPLTDLVVELDAIGGEPIKIHTNADAQVARDAGLPLL